MGFWSRLFGGNDREIDRAVFGAWRKGIRDICVKLISHFPRQHRVSLLGTVMLDSLKLKQTNLVISLSLTQEMKQEINDTIATLQAEPEAKEEFLKERIAELRQLMKQNF